MTIGAKSGKLRFNDIKIVSRVHTGRRRKAWRPFFLPGGDLVKNFPLFVGFRATETELVAIRKLQRAYGLPSMSETVRRAIQQTALGSGLLREVIHDPGA